MKKVLSILVVTLFIVGFTSAQTNPMKLGVGVYVGLPIGTFGDATSFGIGGVAQGEMDLSPQIVGTASVGYLSFTGKDVSGVKLGTWSIIPVLVGAKYYFQPSIYGLAQVGLNFISYDVPAQTFFGYTIGGGSVSDTKFGFNIGVGYDAGKLDFAVKYGSFASDASAISLTALYKFSL